MARAERPKGEDPLRQEDRNSRDPSFQTFGQMGRIYRNRHVFYRVLGGEHDGMWKCIECGWMTEHPELPEADQKGCYRPLTDDERMMELTLPRAGGLFEEGK